jgi:hypothetical protein
MSAIFESRIERSNNDGLYKFNLKSYIELLKRFTPSASLYSFIMKHRHDNRAASFQYESVVPSQDYYLLIKNELRTITNVYLWAYSALIYNRSVLLS